MPYKSPDIIVNGATHNNLKNICLQISPGEITVITGLSGSGKSTLLFDVLHAEGQRRYVETFSPYVRQFLPYLDLKLNRLRMQGHPLRLNKKNSVRNSRSTVGTMTELCDYFKVWFSAVSSLFDPQTGHEIKPETAESQANTILKKYSTKNVVLGFQCKRPEKLTFSEFITFLERAGHSRILINEEYVKISSLENTSIKIEETFVVVDKIQTKRKTAQG